MWRSPCRREKIHLDMTNKHPGLLWAEVVCLLVVDIQERFRAVVQALYK